MQYTEVCSCKSLTAVAAAAAAAAAAAIYAVACVPLQVVVVWTHHVCHHPPSTHPWQQPWLGPQPANSVLLLLLPP
jgi:hypothetical protein